MKGAPKHTKSVANRNKNYRQPTCDKHNRNSKIQTYHGKLQITIIVDNKQMPPKTAK